jgi:hypothetical protein
MMTNGSSVDLNLYNPNDLELVKYKKELWERGIDLFNKKPIKGIKYLQDNSLVGSTQTEIAQFLFEDERLDKTSIGDFLGRVIWICFYDYSCCLTNRSIHSSIKVKAMRTTRKSCTHLSTSFNSKTWTL